MSNSVRPHRQQATRLPRPWDSPEKNTGVGCHFLLQCMKVKNESKVAQSCPTLSDPWTAAYQASPSMGFSGQEYWSGVPLSSFTMATLFYIPTNNAQVSNFSTSSHNTCHLLSFDDGHLDSCEVRSHCGFDLHFPHD